MALMGFDNAIQVLRDGGQFVELAEAIAVVKSSPQATLEHLMLGLLHRGFVAEQAALALYRRTGHRQPDDPDLLEFDPLVWAEIVRKLRESTNAPRPPVVYASGERT